MPPLIQKFADEFNGRDAQCLSELDKLYDVDPAFASLAFRDEGLRVAQPRRQLYLRHTLSLARRTQHAQEQLVVGIVGRVCHRAMTGESRHAKVHRGIVQKRLFANLMGECMKRIAILLVVFLALAWIGSKLVPRTRSPATVAQALGKAKGPKVATPEPDKPQSAAEKKAQQEKWFGAETIVAAERAVKASLSDPDSAQFKDVYANYTVKFGVVACGQVNAKNKMGGYAGFKRFVSAGQSVILEGQDNIADAWAAACSS